MKRLLHCDCGYEVRAEDDDGLVTGVQRHALDAHGMEFTQEEALVLLLREELAASQGGRPFTRIVEAIATGKDKGGTSS